MISTPFCTAFAFLLVVAVHEATLMIDACQCFKFQINDKLLDSHEKKIDPSHIRDLDHHKIDIDFVSYCGVIISYNSANSFFSSVRTHSVCLAHFFPIFAKTVIPVSGF